MYVVKVGGGVLIDKQQDNNQFPIRQHQGKCCAEANKSCLNKKWNNKRTLSLYL